MKWHWYILIIVFVLSIVLSFTKTAKGKPRSGLLLALIAMSLTLFLTPIGFIYGNIKYALRLKFSAWLDYNDAVFTKIAVSVDQYDNLVMSPLLNDTIRKSDGHLFGDIDETISYVIGRNKKDGTLTLFGRFWAFTLNLIDKGHTEKAILNEEGK